MNGEPIARSNHTVEGLSWVDRALMAFGRFVIALVTCECAFLLCASVGLLVNGTPFNEENWGGYLILAFAILPQAFLVAYVLFATIVWQLSRFRHAHRRFNAGLTGAILGAFLYLIGANIKWLVPWMVFITRDR
jgi:hypothetical protein